MLVYHTTLSAAALLHELQLHRVMRAPSRFFDTTPTGRVVQRFSKDIDIMDEVLPLLCEDLVLCAMEVFPPFTFFPSLSIQYNVYVSLHIIMFEHLFPSSAFSFS